MTAGADRAADGSTRPPRFIQLTAQQIHGLSLPVAQPWPRCALALPVSLAAHAWTYLCEMGSVLQMVGQSTGTQSS